MDYDIVIDYKYRCLKTHGEHNMGKYTVRVTTLYSNVEGDDVQDAADNYMSVDGDVVQITVFDGSETTVVFEDDNDVDLYDEDEEDDEEEYEEDDE